MARILVVDDIATNRQVLANLLGPCGHEVLEAADGDEGLASVRAERPDLVIADILMPTMDGFEFVRRLRSEGDVAATNVVFYTAAYSEHEARTLARGCGVEHIITKPAEPRAILDVLDQVLGVTVAPPAPPPIETFDREHLKLLGGKLTQKVAELEAVRLRLEEMIVLGQQLSLETDTTRMLDKACRAARRMLGARHALLGLVDESDVLQRMCVSGPALGGGGLAVGDVSGELLADVLARRRAVRREGPRRERGDEGLPPGLGALESFLAVPLATPARAYGWIGLADKLGASRFSDEDESLALSLAGQTAIAYENACRYEQIQRHTIDLEKQVEERTAELKRSNAELEQFAYVASHDLQEPLRKVVGYMGVLADRCRDRLDPEEKELMGVAVDAARRMRELIQDLLAYARAGRQPVNVRPVDCEKILRRVLQDLSGAMEDSHATVTIERLPEIVADEPQVYSLFQNLISNALKFRGSEPSIVKVSARRSDDVPGAVLGRPEWVFSVQDNGIGVEPQHGDRIFKLFQRLHGRADYPGTGVGLAICRKVVERLGGRIWVDSTPGKGATFFFTVPRLDTGSRALQDAQGGDA